MQRLILLVLLVMAVSAAVLNCSGTPLDQPAAVGPAIGNVAPEFSLTSVTGDVVSLQGLRGKPVVLNIWAIWCPPCRAELPMFQDIFTRYGDKFNIVTVNIGEDRSTISQFMSDNKFSFPVLIDYPQKSVAVAYKAAYIPDTFTIDKSGIVKSAKVGSFESKAELESLLK